MVRLVVDFSFLSLNEHPHTRYPGRGENTLPDTEGKPDLEVNPRQGASRFLATLQVAS